MVAQRLDARKHPVNICAGQSIGNWSKTGGQGQGRTADLPLFRLAGHDASSHAGNIHDPEYARNGLDRWEDK
jgi:hypothetical protein